MRLATRQSQDEYAKLCGVAPRVLKRIEAGELRVQVESLEKLIKPFGYAIGLVQLR
jgi:transcriptional regulator with XRE-family HTH domain